MLIGYDILGLAHPRFPWKRIRKMIPLGSALGVFDHPFGNVAPRLELFLTTNKFPAVRVQMFWDNHPAHQNLIPLAMLERKCKKFEIMARTYPEIKFFLSPTTEHAVGHIGPLRARMDVIRSVAPSCTPVNNPRPGGVIMPHEMNEVHGTMTDPGVSYFFSFDGTDALEHPGPINLMHQHSKASIRFFWTSSFNLREYNVPPPPIPERMVKTTRAEMRGLRSIHKEFNV